MRLYVGGELFHGTSPVKVIEPDRLGWTEELRAEFALGVPWTTAPLADHDRLGAKAVSGGSGEGGDCATSDGHKNDECSLVASGSEP